MSFCPESLKSFSSKLSIFRFIDDARAKLRNKQYFPYSYINSHSDFNNNNNFVNVLEKLEEEQLPQDPSDWLNYLLPENTDAELEEKKEEIKESNKVFEEFGCKTLRGYMELYLKVDILLLCEVMDDFRNKLIDSYTIDPFYSFTLPGYSWKAWGFNSNIELEYFKSREIADFFMGKDVIRGILIVLKIGGITTVCRSKSLKANNPYMKNYDSSQDTNYIFYLDITNLYVNLNF